MKRWMNGVCAAVLACGCTKSQVAADADIAVSGQVLQENKQPLANTLLSISRSSNSECAFSLIFGDLDWKAVKTGADGTFSQTWLGADTRSGDIARCFTLNVPGGAKGSSLSTDFHVQSDQLQFPLLQQWSGTLAAAATTGGVNVSFKDVSETQPDVGTTSPLLHVVNANSTLWTMDASGSPTLLDDDLLEDATGLSAYVSVSRSVTQGKNTFAIYQRSDSVDLPARTQVPLSRGASCTYPSATTPCPLTDGDLGTSVLFQQGTRQVVIQLAKAQVLHKALLRNLNVVPKPFGLVLEGSSDGVVWLPLGNLLDSSTQVRAFIEVPISTSTALSQVRVTLNSTNTTDFIQGLSELSLF